MTLTEICNDIEVWKDWKTNYNKFVPQFIDEAKKGKNWDEWDNAVFDEFFMRSSGQCVSSLQQGYFTNKEKEAIKLNWSEIAPLLKQIADSQDAVQFDTYLQLKGVIRKYTSQDRRAATNRLIASLQPHLLCTVVNEYKLNQLINAINGKVEDFNFSWGNNWFENSNALLEKFKDAKNEKNGFEMFSYPWQVYEKLIVNNNQPTTNDMSETFVEEAEPILRFKRQIILQGPPGTGKTRAAKKIALEMLGLHDEKELENNEQFKIVQFHPSYTYEDFVRGIEAQANPTNKMVEYKTANKALSLFAERAHKNYRDSQKKAEELSLEGRIAQGFSAFVEEIESLLEDGPVQLTQSVSIVNVEDDAFRYKGQSFGNELGERIPFSAIIQAYKDGNKHRQDIKKNTNLPPVAKYRSGYYIRVVNRFRDFLAQQEAGFSDKEIEKVTLKNFVLIIDEINRANLSSVLGELIYALEYRGEALDGMYEIDGGRQLILPPNLYIIGTMNTADRSVGHIDYAIRRRFAFVDVPPQRLMENDEIWFNTAGFDKVALLFNDTNVSPEFESKDVQIGHSYFIVPKKDAADAVVRDALFQMKMNYEVVPILLEYIRDGILVGKVNGEDIKTYVEGLGL